MRYVRMDYTNIGLSYIHNNIREDVPAQHIVLFAIEWLPFIEVPKPDLAPFLAVVW